METGIYCFMNEGVDDRKNWPDTHIHNKHMDEKFLLWVTEVEDSQ